MAEFKKGDVVVLKSGGPKMTVEDAEYNDEIMCVWFDEKSKQPKRDTFSAELLKEPPKPSAGAVVV